MTYLMIPLEFIPSIHPSETTKGWHFKEFFLTYLKYIHDKVFLTLFFFLFRIVCVETFKVDDVAEFLIEFIGLEVFLVDTGLVWIINCQTGYKVTARMWDVYGYSVCYV